MLLLCLDHSAATFTRLLSNNASEMLRDLTWAIVAFSYMVLNVYRCLALVQYIAPPSYNS